MFVGCSEISISVIVKHVQNIGHKSRLFVYLGGLAKFSSAWGDRKNCWVMVCLGVSVPRLTPWVCKEHKDTIAYGEKCCIRETTEQLVIQHTFLEPKFFHLVLQLGGTYAMMRRKSHESTLLLMLRMGHTHDRVHFELNKVL